ncbi:hypothetical protein Droror1_Dr00004985 [Drosera rotundifolia]
MIGDDCCDESFRHEHHQEQSPPEPSHDFRFNFDSLSLLSRPMDYYRVLEVDYDATEDMIRSNFIRLALKWHPDKHKGHDDVTSKFQEINEAYQVLSDPVKRQEYDMKGMVSTHDCNIVEYLNRYKGLILTCNGLGMKHSIW